jgi:hypothetical protein
MNATDKTVGMFKRLVTVFALLQQLGRFSDARKPGRPNLHTI